MRTSEMAAVAEVNVQTLRYYERRGFLPVPARRGARYRDYDAAAVRRVRFIKRAQELGFTLDESPPAHSRVDAALTGEALWLA